MVESKRMLRKELSVGDAAVEGLFAGVLAGIAMAAYLVAAGLWLGELPGEVLRRFAPGSAPTSSQGFLMHLAISGVYGLLFGLVCQVAAQLWKWAPPAWQAGAAGSFYGLALYFFAQAVILPGTGSALKEFSQLHFALAHMIYGISLGMIINRNAWR
jgi:hypothetical protein